MKNEMLFFLSYEIRILSHYEENTKLPKSHSFTDCNKF